MLKVLSGKQIRNIDKKAVEELKIPGLILMENAGKAVFEQICEILQEIDAENPSVLVICGKGNNGGDGFVAARHLIEEGIQTYVISIYSEDELSGDALVNHNALKNFTDITYYEEIDLETLKDIISVSTVVVDAILGTGLSSEVKDKLYDIIQAINEYSDGYILSIDIPSGIDSNTGKILGNAVIADYTVSFFAPKLGNVLYPGAELSGEVIIADIGIPYSLLDGPEYNINLITGNYACGVLPIRSEDSHKGTFGYVLCIAGSLGMTGAAYFSAYSALKVGAGYVRLALPESLIQQIAPLAPDVVYLPLAETPNKTISKEALSKALDESNTSNVFLVGPGLGRDESTIDFVLEYTKELTDRGLTSLFDGDALYAFSTKEGFALPLNSIITPHPKELARLLKITVEEVQNDRIKAARTAAEKFNVITVLKGARTIIADPNGTVYINPTGSSALAKAGTGDVLAGMIAGFLAQGVNSRGSAILGAYLHGMAGEIAEEDLTEYSVTASDLIYYIPEAISAIL